MKFFSMRRALCVALAGLLPAAISLDASAASINVGSGTITGLGAGSGTISYGGVIGGVATFTINGDFDVLAGDTVSVTNNLSNAAIKIIVGNDVNVGLGATFDFGGTGT